MLSALGLIVTLQAAPAAAATSVPDGQATLQSCVLEASGWVCRYRLPQGVQAQSPTVILESGPAPVTGKPVEIHPSAIKPSKFPGDEAEQARRERLIRRCADASWMSLCTPGDRREAKALQEAAAASARLRLEVTTLASEGKCPQAVRTALQGGDLTLAREIREFCDTPK